VTAATKDMIHKKGMHRIIQLLLLLLSQYTELIYSDSDPNQSENAVKRYNLQDLLGQGLQLAPSVGSQEQSALPKTQTIDVAELLAAAQKAAAKQEVRAKDEDIISKFAQNKKPVDVELSTDKNGNLNLADIPGLTRSTSSMSLNDLQSLLHQKQASQETAADNEANHVMKQEFNLGKQKLEIETAGKRTTRYTLAKGPDGGLNLVPILDDSGERKYEVLQPKGYEEKAGSRQQMQLTTLSQALYSPFPSEANILHLHLKGKDGKDGKAGNKGNMGPVGPKGPEGPRGPKGDAGTCSAQINGLFECTPDELDSLSNRVDYLEKICKKVENAAKKHVLHSNDISKPSTTASSTEEPSKKESSSSTNEAPKKDTSTKEDTAAAQKEKKEQDAAKEKEKLKEEAREAIEKEIKEEVARRLKEQLTLKLEKEVAEKAETRTTKEEKDVKERDKEGEKDNARNMLDTKQAIPLIKIKDAGNKENKNRDVFSEVSKKDMEPIKKLNKDSSPPTLRSMIDIKAKLKIAELDLMDRVNQARAGAMKQ